MVRVLINDRVRFKIGVRVRFRIRVRVSCMMGVFWRCSEYPPFSSSFVKHETNTRNDSCNNGTNKLSTIGHKGILSNQPLPVHVSAPCCVQCIWDGNSLSTASYVYMETRCLFYALIRFQEG